MKTFVVRVWTPAEPRLDDDVTLHGVVEHVGSSEASSFSGPDELLEALRTELLTKEED